MPVLYRIVCRPLSIILLLLLPFAVSEAIAAVGIYKLVSVDVKLHVYLLCCVQNGGNPVCHRKRCPPLPCANPVKLDTECCPTCPGKHSRSRKALLLLHGELCEPLWPSGETFGW